MLGVVVNENNSHLLVLENRILLECAYAIPIKFDCSEGIRSSSRKRLILVLCQ